MTDPSGTARIDPEELYVRSEQAVPQQARYAHRSKTNHCSLPPQGTKLDHASVLALYGQSLAGARARCSHSQSRLDTRESTQLCVCATPFHFTHTRPTQELSKYRNPETRVYAAAQLAGFAGPSILPPADTLLTAAVELSDVSFFWTAPLDMHTVRRLTGHPLVCSTDACVAKTCVSVSDGKTAMDPTKRVGLQTVVTAGVSSALGSLDAVLTKHPTLSALVHWPPV